MRKRVFFQNAAVMTLTSLLLRSIGILFRIYVSNRVGAEGMGLYQLIISVYVLASSFASSGLTVAVTRCCTDELAKDHVKESKRILMLSIGISILVGILSGIVIFLSADAIAENFLHDTRAVPSLKILTVSLPFMGMSSCIKGYFFARRRVSGSSIAQILEQLVRIGSIMMLLNHFGDVSVESACLAVLSGDTISEIVSCIFMLICYILDERRLKHISKPLNLPKSRRMRHIMSIAMPITAGRYLGSGLRTAENMIVPQTLSIYNGSHETSLEQFGKLKGMALPLIFFPSSFLTAFTSLLIPEISEADALAQKRRLTRTIERSLHMTLLSSYLIGGVFWVLAEPIAQLVYHDSEVGFLLRVLAPLAPVMYLESVIVGILKGLNQQTHSLLYSVIDSGSRILLILAVLPSCGMNGFLLIMIFSNLLTCGLNMHRLCKVSEIKIPIAKWIWRPLLGLSTAIGICLTLDNASLLTVNNNVTHCVICGILISGIYILLLPILGCVEQEDFISIPHKR